MERASCLDVDGRFFRTTRCKDVNDCPQQFISSDEKTKICCAIYDGKIINGCFREITYSDCRQKARQLTEDSGINYNIAANSKEDCSAINDCFVFPEPIRLNTSIPGLGSLESELFSPSRNDRILVGGFAVYLAAIYKLIIIIAVILAFLVIVAAGYLWITAAGSAERVKSAQKMIGNAVIGIILAIVSYTILQLINPKIASLPTIAPLRVPREEIEDRRIGEKCKKDEHCDSPLVCNQGVCAKKTQGDLCEETDECEEGLFCKIGIEMIMGTVSSCKPKLPRRASCEGLEEDGDDDFACVSGSCNEDGFCR